MYLAELNGKLSQKEDILTSNVFSFFKYSDRQVFLYQFIKLLGLDVNQSEAKKAEFIFWPTYGDGTQPDLVIIIGKYYLLFEAKLDSHFGLATAKTQHQLIREWEGGSLEARNLKKIFKLIAVTAHYSRHQFINEISNISLPEIIWINWHKIALLIEEIISNYGILRSETLLFAEDLHSLLVRKKLRKYAGKEIFSGQDLLIEPPMYLFLNPSTAQYRGDFIGFTTTLCNTPKLKLIDGIIFHSNKKFIFNLHSKKLLTENMHTIFFKAVNNE
ncbi:hypothetical protein JW887_03535 [Candidatus Dojkabacteria bacterium]|nr:hypothetical protein [Candidatus Dojkabacteria bacterium]